MDNISSIGDSTATCEHCGGDYPQERADLGYSYCMKPACRELGTKRVTYMEVGHNKTMAEIVKVTDEAMEALKHTGRRGR